MITEEQAIELYDSKFWEELTNEQIVQFQLYVDLLCMPFGVFQLAVEKCLGRSVWTHEFAFPNNLRAEFEKKVPKPSFEDIVNLIPEDKRVIILHKKNSV